MKIRFGKTAGLITPRVSVLVISILLGFALGAKANLLVNGSFELGAFRNTGDQSMVLLPGATNILGWTVVGANPAHDIAWESSSNTPFAVTAADGNYALDLTGLLYDQVPFSGVAQTIATVPGQAYNLSFEVGSDVAYDPVAPGVVVAITGNPTTTNIVSAIGTNRWQTFAQVFTATTNMTTITITGANIPGIVHVGLDNVVVYSPIDISLDALTLQGNQVVIHFNLISGNASSFKLLQASQPTGPWTTNLNAQLNAIVPGVSFTFTTPLAGPAGFYRVRTP